MGKPNPVLTILVAPHWRQHPAIQALASAGHIVQELTLADADLIIHPAAHRWDDALFESALTKAGKIRYPYVDAALVAARKRRK